MIVIAEGLLHWLGVYSTRVPLYRTVYWTHLCPNISGSVYSCVLKVLNAGVSA